MKLKELDAILRIYETNFRVLHWNSVGIDFNDSHREISTEYYEIVSGTIDKIAEMLCMLGENPCNYLEAVKIAMNNGEHKYVVVKSTEKYDRPAIVELSNMMLMDICQLLSDCIEEVQEPINAGIKSELESILFDYTIQARYINARRLQN